MKLLRLGIILFLLAPSFSLAQTKKLPIALNHSGEDSVGQVVAFSLKEAIRASQGFVLIDNDIQKTRIVANLVSLEIDEPNRGRSSPIAIVVVYDSSQTPVNGIHLNSFVVLCGRAKAETCGKDLLVKIDREIARLQTEWPNLWKTL